jgi:hypothetical protein
VAHRAGSCGRTETRIGQANGFKKRSFKTRVGKQAFKWSRPPKFHQLTYRGVLAPGDPWRDDVVPKGPRSRPQKTGLPKRPAQRYLWHQLLKRIFAWEVLRCPLCRSERRLVSVILERTTIVKILSHLRLA